MNDTCSSENVTWPDWLKHVVFPSYLGTLLVMGVLLNGLALWVFCRRMQGWTETRIYMSNLAVADLCLLCTLPFILHSLSDTSDTPLCQLSQGFYLLNSKLSDANCCLDAICYYYMAKEFQEASTLGKPLSARAHKSQDSLCVTLT